MRSESVNHKCSANLVPATAHLDLLYYRQSFLSQDFSAVHVPGIPDSVTNREGGKSDNCRDVLNRCNTIQHNTTQHNTTQHNTQHNTVLQDRLYAIRHASSCLELLCNEKSQQKEVRVKAFMAVTTIKSTVFWDEYTASYLKIQHSLNLILLFRALCL